MNIKGIDGSLDAYRAQMNRANQADAQRAATTHDAKAPAPAANQSQPAKDTIDVSFAGVLRTTAFSTAMHAGDVRQEKVGAVRESLGSGSFLGIPFADGLSPYTQTIFILAPGGFLTLGLLIGFFNYLALRRQAKFREGGKK